MESDSRAMVARYHDGTKHHFQRFARSLGYLDWASQPHPFRAYAGATITPLFPAPDAAASDYLPHPLSYERLIARTAPPAPLTAAALGDVLRHSLGLSAWKQFQQSRWSLRVNPSSGNLHPTEAYVICGGITGLSDAGGVYHYAPDRHALERRCTFAEAAWTAASGGRAPLLLVALTSIHWREAWKYGERAFRYCQHDLGHAIAALELAGALAGWRAALLPEWSHRSIAALTGIDRDEDFFEAEREEPGCVIALGALDGGAPIAEPDALADAVRRGTWSGRASQLSEDHVQWTFIDEVARATEHGGRNGLAPPAPAPPPPAATPGRDIDARALLLQRRSALAFDGRSAIDGPRFFRMLARVMPRGDRPPLLWWEPRVHFALFVHRVTDVPAGVYLLARDPRALERLRAACRREFLWEPAHGELPLFRLADGDCRWLSARLSCDQDIAADGFFSLGMLADFDASLDAFGPSFYRNLFWESGAVGQVLYLEAEAAGARATGIGCFYDDPVHDLLGLAGHTFQSLYHFTVGMPVEDTRLTSEPGYAWEARSEA